MANIIVGSARIDENGKLQGGKPGDQKQKSSTNDTVGEISMQNFYVHKQGWYILRPKTITNANAIAAAMKTACNNVHIGYDQAGRYGIIKNGVDSKVDTEADCSSTVRACIIKATKKDPGDFNTSNEAAVLEKSGLFEPKVKYVSQQKTPLYNGDVLVTCTKGHTVIVVSGNARSSKKAASAASATSQKAATADTTKYYPKYKGTASSLVVGLEDVGEKDTTKTHRKAIAAANGISGYSGTASENTKLLNLLKEGKLIKQ